MSKPIIKSEDYVAFPFGGDGWLHQLAMKERSE